MVQAAMGSWSSEAGLNNDLMGAVLTSSCEVGFIESFSNERDIFGNKFFVTLRARNFLSNVSDELFEVFEIHVHGYLIIEGFLCSSNFY